MYETTEKRISINGQWDYSVHWRWVSLLRQFVYTYIEIVRCCVGVLSGSAEDFESGDDLYDAVGDILHEMAVEKVEDDVR